MTPAPPVARTAPRCSDRPRTRRLRPLAALPLALALVACGEAPDLVVYVSLDQVFSEQLVQEFERETGLKVEAQYDLEHQKTVGLVGQLIAESAHPRCDVFWNNEVAQTIRLADLGLLQPYDSPSAADIPATFRDPDHLWTGFAARARVLIVNTDLADPAELSGMWDLLDPRWAGRCVVARPLTGTTLTHAAALYQHLGEEQAERYWGFVAAHQSEDPPAVHVARSNGQVMTLVRDGELAWGWTDTDDFNVARESGAPVVAVYPDQLPTEDGAAPLGTLLIPNTVMLMKDAPHPDNARRFLDWVLSREVEAKLAESRSAQIPVRADVPRPDHVRSDIVVMDVDYRAVGRDLAARTEHLKELFLSE